MVNYPVSPVAIILYPDAESYVPCSRAPALTASTNPCHSPSCKTRTKSTTLAVGEAQSRPPQFRLPLEEFKTPCIQEIKTSFVFVIASSPTKYIFTYFVLLETSTCIPLPFPLHGGSGYQTRHTRTSFSLSFFSTNDQVFRLTGGSKRDRIRLLLPQLAVLSCVHDKALTVIVTKL